MAAGSDYRNRKDAIADKLASKNMKVGFIGAGKMAQAIAKGFTTQGIVKAKNILASARTEATLKEISQFQINGTLNNEEVITHSDVLILAVKPQVMDTVLQSVGSLITDDKLVVSIAAGVTLQQLESKMSAGSRVVRLMPNTPMLACAGASIYCTGKSVLPEDNKTIESLFSSVGTCDQLPEHLMDAATGICGSGPAYMFVAIEALSDAGVLMGLPRNIALKLAAQTVYGSGRLVLETGKHPALLKDGVCSPAGTTIAALHELEMRGFRATLMCAVQKAAIKAKELGNAGNTKPNDPNK